VTEEDGKLPGEPRKFSSMDKVPDNGSNAVRKNRLKGTTKLAWSSDRAPASYLIPEPLMLMSLLGDQLGSHQTGVENTGANAKILATVQTHAEQLQGGARLSDDTVKAIESAMEAEYVPFYFHDLRTNEIIAFHAFLAGLTDDYTANYDPTEGYGRVDTVKIYKNTTRRITMSFYVAATSKQDFDNMWVKINKLTTLVYPQYTQGRLLSTDDGNWQLVQPFSQMIGASPLIRLRLGDLIRSNYSRFALARLFGADSNVMKLDGTQLEFKELQMILDKYKSLMQSDKIYNDKSSRFVLDGSALSKSDGAGGGIKLPSPPGIGGSGGPEQAPVFDLGAESAFFEFKIVGYGPEPQAVEVEADIVKKETLINEFGFSSEEAQKKYNMLFDLYGDDAPVSRRVVGGRYKVGKYLLKATRQTMAKALKNEVGSELSQQIDNIDKLAEFMNPDKNAVVKSFKAMGGKGLAGFIDTINFDWYDRVTWEDEPNRRAPKMCKVSLTFSPIHDISPGIDSNGYNRAPVYPVGPLAPKKDNG
jgi:hypothetical protein